MNLVVDCMQVFSRRPLSFFRREQSGLLLELFRRCLKNPALGRYRKTLREIYEHVARNNEKERFWRDCEIYYPIDFMSRAGNDEYVPYFIELLSLLTGLKDIRRSERLPDGYYRLKQRDGNVYVVENGHFAPLRHNVIWKMEDFAPDFYLPLNGMFSDILNEGLYPAMKGSIDTARIKAKMRRIVSRMRWFSQDIWEDFQDAVWNIVLLTNTPTAGPSSLTMRYKYFGGVFFNPFMNDDYHGVESLAHEYIHNRCWLWWELAPLTGVPSEEVSIVSPVTGNRVRVRIMIQALIIYVNALQFYRYVQANGPPSGRTERARLDRRAALLARNIPVLNRRLGRTVKAGTDIRRLFDYLMTVYEGVA